MLLHFENAAFLEIAIKIALVITCAALICWRMQRASAAARHLVWTAAIAISVLMPVGFFIFPRISVPLLPAPRIAAATSVESNTTTGDQGYGQGVRDDIARSSHRQTEAASLNTPTTYEQIPLIYSLWLLGFGVIANYWIIGRLALWRVTRFTSPVIAGPLYDEMNRACRQIRLRSPVELRTGLGIRVPFMVGLIRPKLFLPASATGWRSDQISLTLLHEAAHVKRMDYAVQLLTQLACAMYWFHPLVWLAVRRLGAERELACDDAVLRHQSAEPARYAEHLVAVAKAFGGVNAWRRPAIAMGRTSGLRRRVVAILDAGVNRRNLSARAAALILVITAAAFAGVSCTHVSSRTASPSGEANASAKPPPVVVATTSPAASAEAEREIAHAKPHVVGATTSPAAALRARPRSFVVTVRDNETGKALGNVEILYDNVPKDGRVVTAAQGHATVTLARADIDPKLVLTRDHYLGSRVMSKRVNGVLPPRPLSTCTIRLEPTRPIGGKVVDDEGNPIAGANVEIWINGKQEYQSGLSVERPWTNRAVKTAADGTWQFDNSRVPLDAKSIMVAAWDYHHLDADYFVLKDYTPVADLFAKTAVLTLPRGVPVTGTVTEPFHGRPVAGAKISFGADPGASNKIPPLVTNKQGQFTFAAKPGATFTVTATSAGYKPQVQTYIADKEPAALEFHLTPLHTRYR